MIKVYVDSDVILDVLSNRADFFLESSKILSLCEQKKIEGCTSMLAIANIGYIIRKFHRGPIGEILHVLFTIFEVMDIKKEDGLNSLSSSFSDFEDGIQNFASVRNNCNCIITRNKKDYKSSLLQVYTPSEFIIFLENHS
jgi:hypothetical protein